MLELGIAAAIVLLDFTTSQLMPRRPASVLQFGSATVPARHVVLVFPGFSNPARLLGEGMVDVLGADKIILVVDPGTSVDDDAIYEAVMDYLREYIGYTIEMDIYGHSMGAQIAARFHRRYQREGSKFGLIKKLFMDCSPMQPNSLQTPLPPAVLRLALLCLWPGALMAGGICAGNIVSRKFMPPRLDKSVDRKRYKRYARGMALFNTRAWRAQMLYMLSYNAKELDLNDTPVFYFHSEEPARDKLVRQIRAIVQWRNKYTNFTMVPIATSHAWPMEQPLAYARRLGQIWTESRNTG